MRWRREDVVVYINKSSPENLKFVTRHLLCHIWFLTIKHWKWQKLKDSSCQRYVFIQWRGMVEFVSMGIQHTGIGPRKWRRVGERWRNLTTRYTRIPFCCIWLRFSCWKKTNALIYLTFSTKLVNNFMFFKDIFFHLIESYFRFNWPWPSSDLMILSLQLLLLLLLELLELLLLLLLPPLLLLGSCFTVELDWLCCCCFARSIFLNFARRFWNHTLRLTEKKVWNNSMWDLRKIKKIFKIKM